MQKATKNTRIFRVTLIAAAVFAWVALPFILQNRVSANGDSLPILVRTANLVSPTGSINPHGAAEFQLYESGQKELEVQIEDVSLANGTVVEAFVGGNSVGMFTLDLQRGRLKLRTADGQTVPDVPAGATVEVRNGATVLVAGTFTGGGSTPTPTASPSGSPTGSPTGSPSPTASPSASPTASPSPTGSPSPSPSPSGSPGESEIYAALTGATINGTMPRGFAVYEVHSSRTELEIRVRQVNLPAGTSLAARLNGNPVGNVIMESGGEGRLRLRSDRGETVPVVVVGDAIVIRNGDATILSGTFAGGGSPTPSPSPTGTPQSRFFEGRLTQPTAPTTNGPKGELKVTLNAAENQATITGEYSRLTSAQTGAKITADVNGTIRTVHDFGALGGTERNVGPVTIAVTGEQVALLRMGLWIGTVTTANNPTVEITGAILNDSSGADFDGDGGNDFSVFRPSTGTWYADNGAGFSAQNFGSASDIPVSADYDGDGKTDRAIFRNVNGQGIWDINNSSDGTVFSTQFGFASDKPVRGDFDGDGRNDIAIFRPSTGVWYVQKSNGTGYQIVQWGVSEDIPMSGDMDGDGRADITVFRPSTGVWYWINSETGAFGIVKFGQQGDVPVRGDFDGDGRDDVSVYRPSTGVWYIWKTRDGGFDIRQWGLAEDIPVAGNYDGDDRTDIAVFRPSTGDWYIWRSVDNSFEFRHFGLTGDIPTVK